MKLRCIPLLLLTACAAADQNTALLEDQVPPPPFAATLHSTPWIPGADVRMILRNGTPNDTVKFVIGYDGVTCPPILNGLCADLSPVRHPVVATATTDSTGRADVTLTIPSRVQTGRALTLQAFGGLGGAAWNTQPWHGETVASCPGSAACNLLGTPGLDAWTAPWATMSPNLTLTWDALDVNGDPASGSMRFTNNWGGNYSSGWQCIAVTPGEVYDYGGWGYMPSSTSAGARMFAEYLFYSGADCTGGLTGFAESSWVDTLDTWVWMGLSNVTVPPGTGSMRPGHGVINLGGDGRSAVFDDLELYRH